MRDSNSASFSQFKPPTFNEKSQNIQQYYSNNSHDNSQQSDSQLLGLNEDDSPVRQLSMSQPIYGLGGDEEVND